MKSLFDFAMALVMEDSRDEYFSLAEDVDSSAIETIGYDEDSMTLTIRWISGETYEYYGVDEKKAKYFIDQSPSKGRYANKRVKPLYTYSHI